MDPVRELNIGILMRENNVLWLSFACQDMKRTAIRHRRNPKVRRQTIIHIEIPDEHFTTELSKRCRDMRGICRLRDSPFLIADGNNRCTMLRVVHKALSQSMGQCSRTFVLTYAYAAMPLTT